MTQVMMLGVGAPQPAPPPAPRAVPLKAMNWSMRFWMGFGSVFVFISLFVAALMTIVGGPVWDDWLLDARGVEVKAKPYDVRRGNISVNGESSQEICYRYRDKRGRRHKGKGDTFHSQLVEVARQGESIRIEYDKKSPGRSRLAEHSASLLGPWVGIPLLVALLATIPILLVVPRARRDRRLYRNGTATQAQVTHHGKRVGGEGGHARSMRHAVLEVHYQFQGPRGPVTGCWETAHPPPPGMMIWVLYDPDAPEHNMAAIS